MSMNTTPPTAENPLHQRLWMMLIGALAGLSLWLLVDVLPDAIASKYLLLWIGSVSAAFFTLTLGLSGVLSRSMTVKVAAVWALFCAALLQWSTQRFLEFDDVFEAVFSPVAWLILILIGAPFGAAAVQKKTADYTYLFDTTWGIVVRYLAGFTFLSLFWGLVFLSNALFGIVGLTLIQDLLDVDFVPYLLSGLVLGLALAVAQELKDFISPYLLLRMIRLLLPLVLIVVAIFVVAVPIRGLSDLFGGFSATAILLAITLIGVTLITSSLDRNDQDAVTSNVLVWSCKALTAILPIVAFLANWAIFQRVFTYGWTPQRLAAAIAAIFVLAYALFYLFAVLRGGAWMGHIRRANIMMALATLTLSALWMTPFLNAERISAQSQLARYLNGETLAKDFPAWEMQNEWGVAGQSAIAQLQTIPGQSHSDVLTALQKAKDTTRYQFERAQNDDTNAIYAQRLAGAVMTQPSDMKFTPENFATIYRSRLEDWASACTVDAKQKCLLIIGPFDTHGDQSGMLFIPRLTDSDIVKVSAFSLKLDEGNLRFDRQLKSKDGQDLALSLDDLKALEQGAYTLAPSSQQSIWLENREINPDN